MSIALLIIFLFVCLLDSGRVKVERAFKAQELNNKWGGRTMNPEYHNQRLRYYFADWDGEKKEFPSEYIPYFRKCEAARRKYIVMRTSIDEHYHGYRPLLWNEYDQRTFNPWKNFEESVEPKIKLYNETKEYVPYIGLY